MKNFTRIPNSIITDNRFQGQSLRVLLFILQHSSIRNWVWRRAFILDNLNIERKTYERAINQLIELGYLDKIEAPYGHVEWKLRDTFDQQIGTLLTKIGTIMTLT